MEDYLLGRPFSFTRQGGEGHIAVWQKELGIFFFQDDFRLRDNFSIAMGMRWDWQNFITDRNNLAPRLAIAYAPGRRRKTVIRVGAGIFYDKTGWRSAADTIRYDGKRLREILLTNPPYPNPFAQSGPAHTLRGNLSRYFSGTVQYALGRAWNDTGAIYSFPANNFDLSEWGRADFDQRHRFNLAGSLKASSWFNVGILFSAHSGRPYELTLGRDVNRDGFVNDRPPGVRRNSLQGPGGATLV